MFFKDHSTVIKNPKYIITLVFVAAVPNILSPQSSVLEKPLSHNLALLWAHSQATVSPQKRDTALISEIKGNSEISTKVGIELFWSKGEKKRFRSCPPYKSNLYSGPILGLLLFIVSESTSLLSACSVTA